jgi:hypothetical protein
MLQPRWPSRLCSAKNLPMERRDSGPLAVEKACGGSETMNDNAQTMHCKDFAVFAVIWVLRRKMQFSGYAVTMVRQHLISRLHLMELMLQCGRHRSALVLASLSTWILSSTGVDGERTSQLLGFESRDILFQPLCSKSALNLSTRRRLFLVRYLNVAPTPTHSRPVGPAASVTGHTGSCGQLRDKSRSSAAGGRT